MVEALRSRAPRALVIVVLVAHAFLLVRAYGDVHKRFGFQPFNESDTWTAEIVRWNAAGTAAEPVDDATWNELIGHDRLRNPSQRRHASSGAAATIDYLDRALDYAAARDGHRWEARVTWWRDGDGPHTTVLDGP